MTDEKGPAQQVAEAYRLYQNKQVDAAQKLCRKILAKHPNTVHALHLMGVIEYQAYNFPRALQLIQRAHQLAPDNAEILRHRAKLLVELGDTTSGIKAYEKLAVLKPEKQTYALLAALYKKTDALDQGLAFLEAASQRTPNDVALALEISDLSREHGRFEDAKAFAEQALRLAPMSCPAMSQIGVALLKQKEYAAGITALDKGASITTDSLCAHGCSEIKADALMIQSIARLPREGLAHKDDQSPRDAWESEAISALSAQITAGPPGDVNVVFFHVDWNGNHPFIEKTSTAASVDYKSTLMIACQAARRAYGNASIFVLTDTVSDLSGMPDFVCVLRVDLNPDQMMYARMRAYRALAMTGMLRGPILFLDTDVCLNPGFTAVFDGSFDIGLTYRNEQGFWHMPVNEGVLLADNGNPGRVNRFFGESLDIYESLAEHEAVKARYAFSIKMWRGGQLSLGALVDWDVPPAAPARRDIRGLRYRFLPGILFNYAVKSGDSIPFLESRRAVHFKGASSKAAMTQYLAATNPKQAR